MTCCVYIIFWHMIGAKPQNTRRDGMRGDQVTAGPTDQRHRLVQVEALLQQPRHPQPPQPTYPRPVMQHQQQPAAPPPQQERMMLPPAPQGFFGAGMPQLGTWGLDTVAVAEAEAAARARAAEQMACEDAWKVLNPDFRTPFASVEDAVSRLLPYHVFADLDEDEDVNGDGNSSSDAAMTERSIAQEFEDEINAKKEYFLAEFEKQVLTFNIMTRQRAEGLFRSEEHLMLEKALFEDERRQTDQVRAAVAQRQQQEQQEAARARLALVRAQAAADAWPQAQPSPPSWQQTLAAAAAAARGQGSSGGQAMAPAVFMQQQQEMVMTPGAWQALAASRSEGCTGGQALIQAVMMQQLQQQQQLEMMAAAAERSDGSFGGQALTNSALTPAMVMQLLHQQQQEMMAAGTWQPGGRQVYMTPRGDGSSSSQVGDWQQQPGQGQATALALPWHSSAERSGQ